MKKTLAAIFALATALSLAACGGGNEGAGTGTTTTSKTEGNVGNGDTANASQYAEPAEDELEYSYDASLGGVKITNYSGSAAAIRFPAELDGEPVKGFQLNDDLVTHVEIPYGFTEVTGGAFNDCINLVSVIIPDSVTEIGDAAFLGCISLISVTIPDSVTEIGYCPFMGCNDLTVIYKGETYTSANDPGNWWG